MFTLELFLICVLAAALISIIFVSRNNITRLRWEVQRQAEALEYCRARALNEPAKVAPDGPHDPAGKAVDVALRHRDHLLDSVRRHERASSLIDAAINDPDHVPPKSKDLDVLPVYWTVKDLLDRNQVANNHTELQAGVLRDIIKLCGQGADATANVDMSAVQHGEAPDDLKKRFPALGHAAFDNVFIMHRALHYCEGVINNLCKTLRAKPEQLEQFAAYAAAAVLREAELQNALMVLDSGAEPNMELPPLSLAFVERALSDRHLRGLFEQITAMIPSEHFREDDRLATDFPVTPLRRWMNEERAQRDALAGKLFDANAKIMELQNQRKPRRKKYK